MEANTVFRSPPGRGELTFGTDFNSQDISLVADRIFGAAPTPQQVVGYDFSRVYGPSGSKRIVNPHLSAILERMLESYLRLRIVSEKTTVQHILPRRFMQTHCPMCAHPIVQDESEATLFDFVPGPEIGWNSDAFALLGSAEEPPRWELVPKPPKDVVSQPETVALSFESKAEVPQATTLNITNQLSCMREMEDGWLGGAGKAPTHEGLTKLGDWFAMHFSFALTPPYLYPTAEGGVRAEWTFGRNEVSLNIDLDTLSGYWHTVDLATREDEENTLDLTEPSSWQWLSARIQALENISE